ncbi:unnamed protein product [Brassica oleracea var. botrytis]|uniref:(rape) hypothetical protein n=1 Tax=Brassica napus TaxID=3708 RepID=A0A816MP10_BRANA|nr:unnamed protein product [Brassica napus]
MALAEVRVKDDGGEEQRRRSKFFGDGETMHDERVFVHVSHSCLIAALMRNTCLKKAGLVRVGL